jgi:hypothetical protein
MTFQFCTQGQKKCQPSKLHFEIKDVPFWSLIFSHTQIVPCDRLPGERIPARFYSNSMDIIQHCLSLAPVPYLAPAFHVFNFIWTSVQQVQTSREQLRILIKCISELLCTLDTEYRAGRLPEDKTVTALDNLCQCAVPSAPEM